MIKGLSPKAVRECSEILELGKQIHWKEHCMNDQLDEEDIQMGEAKRRSEAGLPPKMDQSQLVYDIEVYAVDKHKHRRKIILDTNGKSAVAKAIGSRYPSGLLIDSIPQVFAANTLPAMMQAMPFRYTLRALWREAKRRMRG